MISCTLVLSDFGQSRFAGLAWREEVSRCHGNSPGHENAHNKTTHGTWIQHSPGLTSRGDCHWQGLPSGTTASLLSLVMKNPSCRGRESSLERRDTMHRSFSLERGRGGRGRAVDGSGGIPGESQVASWIISGSSTSRPARCVLWQEGETGTTGTSWSL